MHGLIQAQPAYVYFYSFENSSKIDVFRSFTCLKTLKINDFSIDLSENFDRKSEKSLKNASFASLKMSETCVFLVIISSASLCILLLF